MAAENRALPSIQGGACPRPSPDRTDNPDRRRSRHIDYCPVESGAEECRAESLGHVGASIELSLKKSRQASINRGLSPITLMAVTSQIRQPLATGEVILKDWQAAGLAKPSVLKPLIATLEQCQIVRVMGKLSEADREGLVGVIQGILGA